MLRRYTFGPETSAASLVAEGRPPRRDPRHRGAGAVDRRTSCDLYAGPAGRLSGRVQLVGADRTPATDPADHAGQLVGGRGPG